MDDDLAHLAIIGALEEAEIDNLIPRRLFHVRDNPFETLNDAKFIKTFRLSKPMVLDLCNIVEPFIAAPSRTSSLDVLTALNFYGYGSYQLNVGQNMNTAISQPSVSRAICEVTDVLNRPEIFNRYVHFPRNMNELNQLRNE
ncbi:hypothetical protein NQ315_012938 [Exocentrus adspersus]|uniref:Nuclease HARBI1 n=1 Tax=Exocentrus adspersus TaxID=1586481 RepID=A0AAV8VSF1_9CUCU|nr:hypothetical protein NQ315_012938 [Exocentrus adspersus]